MRSLLRILSLLLVLAASPAMAQDLYLTQEVFTEASFGFAVDLQHDNADPDRLYLVEQQGRIVTFSRSGDGSDAAPFLDIRERVFAGGELGLLGLAFHPDYADNGRFFVYYTTPSPIRTIVAEYARSAGDPTAADPASERVLLSVAQPFQNHNAGQIAFGPDGLFYIALGDGGLGGDPEENGEDPTTLLGSILRIDVDNVPAGAPYGIPEDNPFAPTDGLERDEIYAYGLRNPWRFSFDPVTDYLWTADVGQNAFEEINRVVNGGNYGWDRKEGFACYEPSRNCDFEGQVDPVFVYAHGDDTGFSVTGGHVYRGPTNGGLVGRYIYGDYVTGNVWALDVRNLDEVSNARIASVPNPTSFGVDADNELYVLSSPFGSPRAQVFQFVRNPTTTEEDGLAGRAIALDLQGPNPFRGATTLRVETAAAGRATLQVFDVLGRPVATLLNATPMQPGQVVEARFEARGLPAGLYFARLDLGSERVTRRLIVAQ
ncbi:MAG: PQQ-dependent sugar dehydrogenase [Bacteroidota bacterium]